MGQAVMRRPPKYVHAYIDVRSKPRHYFRRAGFPKVALPGLPWSPQFMAVYEAALTGQHAPAESSRIKPGTLRALAVGYFGSVAFVSMKPRTRRLYRNRIEQLCEQKDAEGNACGDKSAAALNRKHVVKMMAALHDRPESANLLRKVLRAMMQHAVEIGTRAEDPTRDVKAIRVRTDGIHSWSEEEIAQFEARHPVGTKPRLAQALLLYTGQRRGDVVGIGQQHVRRHIGEDGIAREMISIRQEKTGAALDIPVHHDLATIIVATPSEHLTYLTTQFGRPFTSAGFGNWFRKQCVAAGLSHCSAHGLRKAAARRLAEAGCTAHEIAAITGHASLREIVRYTKAADQKRLAVSAMDKVKVRTGSG
jgi:integrase